MSEKIKPTHLSKKAIIYIRQSSLFQVNHYQESKKLQYGMKTRISQMGWQDIEVIDDDLGISASGTDDRCGFERMVAQVCMGKIGAVAARELSRFARNSREWQQLIEVCRVVNTILIDHDSVYDPRNSNDRLLLGLKGSLNEYELDLLRLRSQEARKQKALRGELLVSVPIGYIKSNGCIEKTPDLRIQKAIDLVFEKFLELGSVRQTTHWFVNNDVKMPSSWLTEKVDWKLPGYSIIMKVLKNPVYAGIYCYGKTQLQKVFEDGRLRKRSKRLPMKDWQIVIEDHHEGYISKEKYFRIQAMITENSQKGPSKGAAKRGTALLSGLLRCKRCGRKLMVGYTGREKNALRYFCRRGHLDAGQPKCIDFGGNDVDAAVANEILKVIKHSAIDASCQAWNDYCRQEDEIIGSMELELKQAQYDSQRAWKQYDSTDPENRLVASELEKRWNKSLEQVRKLEQKIDYEKNKRTITTMPGKKDFLSLSKNIPLIWRHPHTNVTLKKRIMRTLIEEVLVDVHSQQGLIDVVIHWKGGIHSELQVRRRKRGRNRFATSDNVVKIIKELVKICSDDIIASALNRSGYKTGHNNRWNRQRVISFRAKRKIPMFTQQKKDEEGWMNLTEASAYLGISGSPLRKAVEKGQIKGIHPVEDGPWVFKRKDLDTPETKTVVEAIKSRRKTPAKRYDGKLSLFESSTCLQGVV
jgi:DNA invertase Pin-like site-specific DNA recombinase